MTQRIFDVENEKDMQDLWDILPHNINRVMRYTDKTYKFFEDEIFVFECGWLRINWNDKTEEIVRPMPEATEQDLGKLCKFWDSEYNPNAKIVGCLHSILPYKDVKYVVRGGLSYRHCHRLTKTEVSELC